MTNLISTFNPEAETVRFHTVQVGEYFRSRVYVDMRPKSFEYGKAQYTVFKKIDKSTAEIISRPGINHRDDGKGYVQKFTAQNAVYTE